MKRDIPYIEMNNPFAIIPDIYNSLGGWRGHRGVHALIEKVNDSDVSSVLDLACGDGRDMAFLKYYGIIDSCVGIDDQSEDLWKGMAFIYRPDDKDNKAGFCGKNNDMVFIWGEILKSIRLLGDNVFDMVVSDNSLEHFGEYKAVLREAYRVTRPGGFTFHTVPEGKAHNDYRHKNHWSLEELGEICNGAGWKQIALERLPVQQSMYYYGRKE